MKGQRLSFNSKVLFVSESLGYYGWNNAGSLMRCLQARKVDPFNITLLCTKGYLKPNQTGGKDSDSSWWFLVKALPKDVLESIRTDQLTPKEIVKILEDLPCN